jgi:hypothetical protein
MTVNKTFDLDRGLLPLALSVFRANLLPCSLAVILLLGSYVGAGFLIAPLAYAALRSLIIMIVGYSAYRTLTSGGKVTGFRAVGTGSGRVPWRYAGIMLLILSPILLLGIIWTAPGSGAGPDSFAQMAFGVIMVTSYAVLYVLFGTALPEVAERSAPPCRRSPSAARSRWPRRSSAAVRTIGSSPRRWSSAPGCFAPARCWP